MTDIELHAALTAAQERIRLLEGAIEDEPHSDDCSSHDRLCSSCGLSPGMVPIPHTCAEPWEWTATRCNCFKAVLAPKETTDGR